MRWTLYGIPQSVKRGIGRILSGSIGSVLWKLLVLTLLAVIAIGLIALGPVGAAIGGLFIATLLSDDVRAFVRDLWHRRWATIETPF